MIQIENNQLFYIYDDKGNRIGIKDRHSVHRDGDWHRGVQLNLVCDGFLLMQQRSTQVDIGKELLDQTLATQLIVSDGESEVDALARGLKEELNLDINELRIELVAGSIKIVKRYEYDPSLYNREFVSLYQANFSQDREVQPASPKVSSVFWKSIKEVKVDAINHPEKFTKTFLMWLKEVM